MIMTECVVETFERDQVFWLSSIHIFEINWEPIGRAILEIWPFEPFSHTIFITSEILNCLTQSVEIIDNNKEFTQPLRNQ